MIGFLVFGIENKVRVVETDRAPLYRRVPEVDMDEPGWKSLSIVSYTS